MSTVESLRAEVERLCRELSALEDRYVEVQEKAVAARAEGERAGAEAERRKVVGFLSGEGRLGLASMIESGIHDHKWGEKR